MIGGGSGFTGSTNCGYGSYCAYQDATFSICLPGHMPMNSGVQCGGKNYEGCDVCDSGFCCTYQNENLSICLPKSDTVTSTTTIAPPTSTKPITSASPTSKVIPLGQQCGGLGFDSTNKACESGAYCYPIDDFKSVCKSLVNGYIPFGGLCGDGSGKQCSPGTVCDSRCSGVYKCHYPLVPVGGQCGGVAYVGGNWCVSEAICKAVSSTVSQCLLARTSGTLETDCLGISSPNPIDCIQGWECVQQDPTFGICLPQTVKFGQQCGGKNYDGCDKCDPYGQEGATYCTYQNDSLSICLPAGYTTTLPVTTPKTTNLISTLKTTQTITTKTTTKSTTKTTTNSRITTKTTAKASPSVFPMCANKWEQCGGINWTGAKCCNTGSSCKQLNPYYFQCL
ncbi:hypothetical protein HK098_003170 [Nowakowskiella sp. JEL0407]|nr:hypothetical protein HK098_003170 [Nowakowskiella sp. JEL0407]